MRNVVSALTISGALVAGGINSRHRRPQMGPAAAQSYWATAEAAVTTTKRPMAALCAATRYTCSVSAARTATGYTRRHREMLRRQREDRQLTAAGGTEHGALRTGL